MKIFKTLSLMAYIYLTSISAFSSHLSGATVWYKSIGNNKYDVFLEFYRDCRGVPMGGPTFTIRNVKTGATSNITPTISSIVDITRLCKTASKGCSPQNVTSGRGFEKHTYKTTIDLTTWKNAGACEVLLGAGQCCRMSGITTGGSANNFWTWSMINLCTGSGNNSAIITDDPNMTLYCNNPTKSNFGASDYLDNDSLVYDLVDPMQDWTGKTSWNTGFNSQNPFTVYWPTGYNKSKGPDPTAVPPIGFYFNRLTGEMIFLPTDCSQSTILAVRISEYRKDSTGKYNLVGYITRDYQTNIQSGAGNNMPSISVADNIYLNDNVKTCFTVSTSDSPYKPSSGAAVNNDTTILTMFPFEPKKNTSASFTIADTKAKLKSAKVCWEPKGLVSNTPYQMVFKVIDNGCDIYASTYKTINIYVQKSENLAWIEGLTYFDKNQNCTMDSTENVLTNQKIVFGTGSMYEIESDSTGRFSKAITAGNYTFKVFNKFGAFVCSKTINVIKGNTYKFDMGAAPKIHITGKVYKDSSKNCKFESNEPIWANQKVFTEPGNYVTTTDANGNYDFKIPAGNYKIKYKPSGANYFQKCSSLSINSSYDTLFTNQNIAIYDSSDILDLASSIGTTYTFGRGDNQEITVVARNNGSETVNGTVWLKFNKKLKFVSAGSYVSKTDSTISWDYTNLTAGNELRFYTVLNADASTCQLNDTMTLQSWLDTSGISKDINWSNNYDKHKIRITGKTEPNLKHEFLTNGYTYREGNQLRYHIRFRNSGKKTLTNIEVIDTLPYPVSASSVKILGASHVNTYSINNNVLKVSFAGINLPDSTTDKIKSFGYFEFTAEVDPKTNSETKFYNRAEIYFDTAIAVKTNKAYNIFTNYVSTGKTNASSYCLSDTLKVSYSSPFQFYSGNKFKLLLSDSTGEFVNSTKVLDSLTSTSGTGVFKIKLPSSISNGGLNFKVKVVSTNPYSKELANGISNSFKIYTNQYKPSISIKDTLLCNTDSIKININSLLDSLQIYDRKKLLATIGNVSSIKLKLPVGYHYITATRKVSGICYMTSDTLIFKNDTMTGIDLICTSHSKSYACFGDTLKLKASNAFSYDFYDDANKFLTQNNSGIFSSVFDYSISNFIYVIGKSKYGCRDTSKVFTIAMRDPLPPDVKFSDADLTLCKNQSVTVTGSGVAGYTSYQLFRNNKSWLNSFTSTISTTDIADKDSIKIKGTDGYGCSNFSKSYGFKIIDPPLIKMTCTDSVICDGVSANQTTFNFSGALSYKLYKNGALFSGVSGSSTSPYGIKDKDYFYGEGTDGIGCKGISNTISVDVVKANISFTLNNGKPTCDGDSLIFNFKGGVTYDLYKNKTLWQTINGQRFAIRTLNNKDSLYAKGTDSFGCKANSTVYGINLLKSPIVTITNKDADNAQCDGEDVTLTVSGGISHDIYRNGVLWKPAISSILVFNDTKDKDALYATCTTNGCAGKSSILTLTVWPIPSLPIITRSGNDLFSSYATGNQWYNNASQITGAVNQKFTPTKFDYYFVKHTSANGCVSPFSNKFSFTTGIEKLNLIGLKIYPNPATDHITIETVELGHYQLKLIDMTGKLINQQSFIGKRFEMNFKVEKGIYQILISNEKGLIKTHTLGVN